MSALKKYEGKCLILGDNIDTDAIIPARYLNITELDVLASHVMEDIDAGFAGRIEPGNILVAGKNFGCGSSREHAPLALRAAGISCVIAESFARIFYRNAINTGLPIFECSLADSVSEGDMIAADPHRGIITDMTNGKSFSVPPYPEFIKKIIEKGGLLEAVRQTH